LKILLKLIAFTLIIIGGYTLFATEYVPRGLSSREDAEVSEADLLKRPMSRPAFIALGGRIYIGKGSCVLCHNSRGRAPLLESVAVMAGSRISEEDYHGEAKNAAEYIIESMLRPSAYVVRGFGTSQRGGQILSPMPAVMGAELGLSAIEVRAVAAYLQSLAGLEITFTPTTPLTLGSARSKSHVEQGPL